MKYSSAPQWAPIVLMESRFVVHKSAKGLERLPSGRSSLASEGLKGGARDLQKTLRCLSQHCDVRVLENNLMRNQCIQ